uniref:Uncharacterized protein n=1 Tax=Anguilla anguilla TaxID=7936 RepID=A0A0E9SZV7_ANGAN
MAVCRQCYCIFNCYQCQQKPQDGQEGDYEVFCSGREGLWVRSCDITHGWTYSSVTEQQQRGMD